MQEDVHSVGDRGGPGAAFVWVRAPEEGGSAGLEEFDQHPIDTDSFTNLTQCFLEEMTLGNARVSQIRAVASSIPVCKFQLIDVEGGGGHK